MKDNGVVMRFCEISDIGKGSDCAAQNQMQDALGQLFSVMASRVQCHHASGYHIREDSVSAYIHHHNVPGESLSLKQIW